MSGFSSIRSGKSDEENLSERHKKGSESSRSMGLEEFMNFGELPKESKIDKMKKREEVYELKGQISNKEIESSQKQNNSNPFDEGKSMSKDSKEKSGRGGEASMNFSMFGSVKSGQEGD